MPSHIFVILDRSSSMAGGFSADFPPPERIRPTFATHSSKIAEAKAQLLSWLDTTDLDHVTLIPFSSAVDKNEVKTLEWPRERAALEAQLFQIEPHGGTNLASALDAALTFGSAGSEDWFIRYLLITDGLSDTPAEDLLVLQRLPRNQGMDVILIDPTPISEPHAEKLHPRGRYIPIDAPRDVKAALEDRKRFYEQRAAFAERYTQALAETSHLIEQISRKGAIGNGKEILQSLSAQMRYAQSLRQEIGNEDFSAQRLSETLQKLEELGIQAKHILKALKHRFLLSLSRPRLVSKGYSSWFLVQIYPPGHRLQAKKVASELFEGKETEETTAISKLAEGLRIEIRLSSAEVEFAPSVKKTIGPAGATATFWGRPKDACKPGTHRGLLAVLDAATGEEYESVPFNVEIVDYLFDHVSRPLIGKVASATTAIASIVTFSLALLGHIDKGFGLASGTAGGLITAFIAGRTAFLFRNRGITTVHRP